MKLAIILLTAAALQVSGNGKAQNITLSQKDAPLQTVFKEIERQSGYQFFYNDKLMQTAKKVTIHVTNATLQQTLEQCFKDQPLTWSLVDRIIVVKQKALEKNDEKNVINELPPPIEVKGRVVNENDEPVIATVTVKGTKNAVSTDQNGFFVLKDVDENSVLIITGVNIETFEVKVVGKTDLATLSAKTKVTEGQGVLINTGFTKMKINEMIGSVQHMNQEQINRVFSTDILSRLQNLTGLLFKSGTNDLQHPDNIVIRGENTIFSRKDPLIVIDNFPVEGSSSDIAQIINSLNPNDVESMTVLKDAAATSIYGSKAANGVIVITTKRGLISHRPRVSLTTNFNIREKPDLSHTPILNSSDYIDVEAYLFDKGYYIANISALYPVLTPAVEIFLKRRNGIISAADSAIQINALKGLDTRDDLLDYYFTTNKLQQYAVSISGGRTEHQYYLSLGFDRNASTNNLSNRYTLNAVNTFNFFNRRLEFTAGVTYSQLRFKAYPDVTADVTFPYAQLADDYGNPLPLQKYRQGYIDTVGGGKLLDWSYYPLNELKYADYKTSSSNQRLDASLRYRIIPGLDLELKYQYVQDQSEIRNYYSLRTFFARDLINQFTDLTQTISTLRNPVPIGGIIDRVNSIYISYKGRAQLNFQRTINQYHRLTTFVGAEIRDVSIDRNANRVYGYNENNGTTVPVDHVNDYPTHFGGNSSIPSGNGIVGSTDRAASFYGSLAYVYRNRYSFSASARKDGSNVFGATTNNKWKPLWSAGMAWDIDQEDFFKLNWLNLRLKATYGYQGNIPPIPAALTIGYSNPSTPYFLPNANIQRVPNPDLRWEKTGQLNLGLEFSLLNKRFSASLEYYRKHGTDIIGLEFLAPSLGYPTAVMKNSADMKAKGWEVGVSSNNIQNPHFSWLTSITYSYSRDRVTAYKLPPDNVGTYVEGFSSNPIVGRPVSAMYSYRWAGLDPDTGDPMGYLNGQVSKNYNAIASSKDLQEMVYNGPAIAPCFGGIMNTLKWKDISFSFFISYKFGYYFRRPSIDYPGLFAGNNLGHPDYTLRWQRRGDELMTNVPSMVYINDPNFYSRNSFYRQSEVRIEKGDHIRLQDVRLSYDFNKQRIRKLPFRNMLVYIYVSNLGVIWKANKAGIDPDFYAANRFSANLPAKAFAFGIKVDF